MFMEIYLELLNSESQTHNVIYSQGLNRNLV